MMRDIAAHDDELSGVGGGAREAAHVACSVAGAVEQVEGAVAVEI